MSDEERAKEDARQKFIASGFAQRPAPAKPKYPWVLSMNDKRFLRSLRIDPHK